MPQLNTISNENKLVEEKANFFSEWFQYYTTNIGMTPDFEVENPLSLVDKIIHQIEKNFEYSFKYLQNYLAHDFFTNDTYLLNFTKYDQAKPLIKKFNSFAKAESAKHWIKNTPDFLGTLRFLRDDLYDNMFQYSLLEIISFLKCSHKVEVHAEEIKYNVKIMVSEYILRGRSRQDVRGAITTILSKDINVFPFPKSITTEKEREVHIKNRTLEGQFQGIYNFLEKEPQNIIVFIKIFGANWSKEMEFCYNKVTFRSKENKLFDEVKLEETSFFQDEQKFIVASINIRYFSYEIALKEARDKVREELNHICVVLGRDLTIDDTNNYLHSFDGIKLSEAWSTDKFHKDFTIKCISDLENNPFFLLKSFDSEAKMHLLNFEYLLVNAKRRANMSDYWHYLETVLGYGNKHKDVEEVVSTIVILEEKQLRERVLLQTLYYSLSPRNFPFEKFCLGLTYDEVREIGVSLSELKMHPKINLVKYPFITELLNGHKASMSPKFFKKSKKYYKSILREAYEQRNFYQHQAISNQKSIIKLQNTLPYIVQRFRWPLFDEIKKHAQITFPEIIEILIKKGNQVAR